MKLLMHFVCMFSTVASSTFLGKYSGNGTQSVKVCGPQTQVCTASFTDAANNPQWSCKPASDDTSVVMSAEESEHGAVICGPGRFYFSPMTCAGGRFEYKKQTIEIETNSWSGGMSCPSAGETVHFPYKMACYSVLC
eukprot:TRINITY_DN2787_c0_g1_i1.p1 TRINITY_DN2787_c0_g1~~TRINITY_DN2787_c0_g1_i1.p1  ORF type:complete len:137 (-),score=9.08 TRINITY_DN2787_c0_g1_i1:223-633(-)